MIKITSLICCISVSLFSIAQQGLQDPTYNTRAFHKSLTGPVNCIAPQNDGSIIIGGDITSSAYSNKYIYRIKADRTIDSSFLAGSGVNKEVYSIVFQPDGKILVGGDFEVFDGQNAGGIIRLLSNGQIDNSFITGSGAYWFGQSGRVRDVFLQNDGKIIVTGDFNEFNGVTRNRIVRLNPNGTVDLTFDPGVGVTGNSVYIYDVLILPDGKMIIGGNFDQVSGSWYFGMARLNSDGSVDNTFYDAQVGIVYDIEKQGNSLIVCGQFEDIDPVLNYPSPDIARFSIDGYVDQTFVSPYINAPLSVFDMGRKLKVMDDLSIYVLFATTIAHLAPNGSFLYNGNQQYFTGQYTLNTTDFRDFAFDSNNQLIAGGYFNSTTQLSDMANALTYVTPHFNTDSTANGIGITSPNYCYGYDIVTDPTNKSTVVGNFKAYNGIYVNGITKLLENGQIDTSFSSGVGFDLSVEGPRTIARQADGKMIVGGVFSTYNAVPHRNLIRLHPNGEADNNFTSTLNLTNFETQKVIVEPNGKIMVVGNGNASTTDGFLRRDVFRLNIDGTLDTSFNAGMAVNEGNPAFLKTIARQHDGKYLLGGMFTSFNYQVHKGLVRLNQNGSIDTSFHIGSGFLTSVFGGDNYFVNSISVQYDNKILVGGTFINFNGTNVNKLVRLNPDGSLDTTFLNTITTFYKVQKTEQQPNGKIVVAAIPTSDLVSDVCILNPDGSLAVGLSPANIFNAYSFGIQTDGKLVVTSQGYDGGAYSWPYNNVVRGVTRFYNEPGYMGNLGVAIQTTTQLTCQGAGTVVINPVNGVPPFLYSWDNAVPTSDSSLTFTTAGVHIATIIDSLGNTAQATVYLEGPINNPSHDLTGNIITSTFRPGFSTPIIVDAYNKTCSPVSGQLKLVLDNDLTITNSTPAPDQTSGDTLIWNLTNIVYSTTHFTVTIQTEVSVNAQIGDSISIFLLTDPIAQDADSTNNLRNYHYPVLNGYDPNDKKVYPVGSCTPHFIDTNQRLTYTVRFQNTGNSEAINLYVLDELSEYLDINTLQIEASSHPMYTLIEADNRVKFKFDNIHLPDSLSAGDSSIGYVVFSISLRDSIANQSLLTNKASIYFDFNDPIITNNVFNTIVYEIPSLTFQSISEETCDSYSWNGNLYTESGIYYYVGQNVYGCDSTIALNLTILPSTDSIVSEVACNSYIWNGNVYTESGIYYYQGQNAYGCDSTIELNLTVITNNDSTLVVSGLDSVSVNDVTYYTSGTYYQSIINPVNNCPQELTIVADIDYTSLDEQRSENYQLYPNPFNAEVMLKIAELTDGINYQLMNSLGKVIGSSVPITTEITTIDMRTLSSGVYFLLIDFGSYKTTIRMEKL